MIPPNAAKHTLEARPPLNDFPDRGYKSNLGWESEIYLQAGRDFGLTGAAGLRSCAGGALVGGLSGAGRGSPAGMS